MAELSRLPIREALDQMSDGFVLLDREYRIVYLNPAGEKLVGVPATEQVGRSVWEIWAGSLGSELERRYRRAMETREAQHFEHRYCDHKLDVLVELHVYPTDGGLAIYFRDIGAQKAQRAEQQRSERIYRAALSNTPDLVYVFDLDHRITYANEALLKVWGRTWQEASGKNCLELKYPEWEAAVHDREIEEVVETKQPIRGEVAFTGTNGRRTYEYIFMPVVSEAGQVEAIAGTARDVTERLQAEEALRRTERLAAAGRLAASVAHEINNPLEAVTNLLFLLRGEPLSEHGKNMLRMAEQELARTASITRKTLGFVRQGSESGVASFCTLCDEAFAVFASRTQQRHIALRRKVETDDVVMPVEFRQILVNLIGNALDAVEDGGLIEVSLVREGGVRFLYVRDTGHGMPPDIQDRIWQPFFTTKEDVGTGLGLWVSRQIAEKEGGGLDLVSSSEEGTVFRVRLPGRESMGDAA